MGKFFFTTTAKPWVGKIKVPWVTNGEIYPSLFLLLMGFSFPFRKRELHQKLSAYKFLLIWGKWSYDKFFLSAQRASFQFLGSYYITKGAYEFWCHFQKCKKIQNRTIRSKVMKILRISITNLQKWRKSSFPWILALKVTEKFFSLNFSYKTNQKGLFHQFES